VITLSRSLARQLRVLLRRCLQPPGPREPPLLRLHVGPSGLELVARQPECALVYRQAGSFPPESLIFRAELLADIEGKDGTVTLAATGDGKAEARWDDGGVPRVRPFDLLAPEQMPELPEMPSRLKPLEPAFLQALGEAARTTARDGVRYALARIQLRGQRGQLVATDGRQLLVQGGLALPWPEDVLIPALPLFVSRDLPSDGPVAIGRTAHHVSLRIGPWLLHLEIDADGRFPNVDTVIPRPDSMASRLHLSEDDARFLVHVLPRLPGSKEPLAPLTLDLGKQVVLRARGDDAPQVSEVLLSGGSSCQGPPVRVACNRHFLRRVVQLGFRELYLRNATTPLLCRDETRTYLFMALEGALSPAADAVRIVSGEATPIILPLKPKAEMKRRTEAMPRPPRKADEPHNGSTAGTPPSLTRSDSDVLDPLAEAEALRALLHDAQLRLSRLLSALKQQRRQTRAFHTAMDSLRNLRLDH
jgi:hypothetical protein